MEINAKTKILDVLAHYPSLEEKIIQAAPVFKNLKNPVLRKTVARLATIEKVAQIGNLDVHTFVNLLRRGAGQSELQSASFQDPDITQRTTSEDPEWIQGNPEYTINGTELLAEGEIPVNRVNELLKTLPRGRYILLVTDFEPKPMIEAIRQQKRTVYSKLEGNNPGRHLTYIL